MQASRFIQDTLFMGLLSDFLSDSEVSFEDENEICFNRPFGCNELLVMSKLNNSMMYQTSSTHGRYYCYKISENEWRISFFGRRNSFLGGSRFFGENTPDQGWVLDESSEPERGLWDAKRDLQAYEVELCDEPDIRDLMEVRDDSEYIERINKMYEGGRQL